MRSIVPTAPVPTSVAPCHPGLPGVVRLFADDGALLRQHVRSDDLITFGAEKRDSLVSAILSVKYSCSAYSAVPGSVLPSARSGTGFGLIHGNCAGHTGEEAVPDG
jgi:hypothetical protein